MKQLKIKLIKLGVIYLCIYSSLCRFPSIILFVKGTVSVISSDPTCKEGNVRFTTVHCVVHLKPFDCARSLCLNMLEPA